MKLRKYVWRDDLLLHVAISLPEDVVTILAEQAERRNRKLPQQITAILTAYARLEQHQLLHRGDV